MFQFRNFSLSPFHNSPDTPDTGAADNGWATEAYEAPPTTRAGEYEEAGDAASLSSADLSNALKAAKEEPTETAEQQEEVQTKQESPEEKPKVEGQKRAVTVTDETGKRTKFLYDPSDLSKLDKLAEQAAGFRKMQAERDRFRAEVQDVDTYKKSHENWSSLEETFSNFGKEGVIDKLLGGDGKGKALTDFLEGKYKERLEWEEMTPSERAKKEIEMQLVQERRTREQYEQRLQKTLEAAEKRQQEMDIRALQQEITPFEQKYSLSGKLGSPNLETVLNRQIKEMAYEQLDKLTSTLRDDDEIPAHVIDRAFRRARDFYSRDIESLIQTKTRDSQTQSRVKAQEAAAAAVGVRTSPGAGQSASGSQSPGSSSRKSGFAEALSSALGWRSK
jgi:hypothetical protein